MEGIKILIIKLGIAKTIMKIIKKNLKDIQNLDLR